MEPQPPQQPQPPDRGTRIKVAYWIAAALMAIAAIVSLVREADYMKAAGNLSLVAALVLLATAKPAETRAKKVLIYALVAISLGLLIARVVTRTP